ncbi:MAG: STAS domain-containing protein [Melioribacteraceae bacterium]|jgi:anti-anti-sigma factor|nr:STAS domain-containing protein [Melioribacteraceae bacterium]WKZ69307.1 MAG: STAS domain-containing protein [Melioribacteraceae bacterium]
MILEERIGDVIVEIINVERASILEANELKDKLSEAMSDGYKKIIIDLSECDFVDSSFLGVLVNSLKKVVKLEGDLKLVGFRPAVRSMFELTRLFRVFESFSSLQEAVKSYSHIQK